MSYIVGLTGGIGSGKSTVCSMLAKRGAIVIDADAIVHEEQRAGTDTFNAMVDAMGAEIVGPDGELDRKKVAAIVFNDPSKREALQAIVWPRVATRVGELIEAAGDDDVVILDIPLLAEAPSGNARRAQKVIVVDASKETQLSHLADKGVAAPDAEARMSAQASREDRLKLADHVVNNDGSLEDLERQVDDLWAKLQAELEAAR